MKLFSLAFTSLVVNKRFYLDQFVYCILVIRPALKDNKIVYFDGIVIFELNSACRELDGNQIFLL